MILSQLACMSETDLALDARFVRDAFCGFGGLGAGRPC